MGVSSNRTAMKSFIASVLVALVGADSVSHVHHVGHGAVVSHGGSYAAPTPAYHTPTTYHAPAPAYHAPAYHAPAPAYHAPAYHAPASYKAPAKKETPKPFAFSYAVADDYSGSNFNAQENQDVNGAVSGSYSVSLPDGRIQTVTYTADHYNGYLAEVSYSGEAYKAPAYKASAYAPRTYAAPTPTHNA